MKVDSVPELVALRLSSENTYESLHPPERMGNAKPIAFGGCTLAVAVNACYQDIPSEFRLYSMTGNFLGGALTDRNYIISIREIRRTRTFITRVAEVGQRQDNGDFRLCMHAVGDFHVREPASMMVYAKPPSVQYEGSPETLLDLEQTTDKMLRDQTITAQQAKLYTESFRLFQIIFETRLTAEGILGQNLNGLAKEVRTTQQDLPLTTKTSADWTRSRKELRTPADHAASVAFLLDAALAFTPLAHSSLFLQDADACGSLDFALRFIANDVNMNDYNLRELKTIAGDAARTYSEVQLYDRSGHMVAVMSQASILRPKKERSGKL